MATPREATAIHEAGHAVVAIDIGIPLITVSIIPDPDHNTLGSCLGVSGGIPELGWRWTFEATERAAYAAAGGAAEQLAGYPQSQWGIDRDVQGVVEDAARDFPDADADAVAAIGSKFYTAGHAAALVILRRRWLDVQRVADLLLVHEIIGGSDVISACKAPPAPKLMAVLRSANNLTYII